MFIWWVCLSFGFVFGVYWFCFFCLVVIFGCRLRALLFVWFVRYRTVFLGFAFWLCIPSFDVDVWCDYGLVFMYFGFWF